MPKVLQRRGAKSALPTSGLSVGELLITTDKNTAHFANSTTTTVPIVPAIDDLATIPSIDGTNDLLMVFDASEAGVQAKKVTFANFKTALNIPTTSTDEKVAVVSGGTSGYLWGSNGTDGLIRMNNSMYWEKDPSNGFVTLHVGTVDCGSF